LFNPGGGRLLNLPDTPGKNHQIQNSKSNMTGPL